MRVLRESSIVAQVFIDFMSMCEKHHPEDLLLCEWLKALADAAQFYSEKHMNTIKECWSHCDISLSRTVFF